jgi:hypothetical protein
MEDVMETRLAQPRPLAAVSVRLIVGGFFVLLGVLLTLDNLNLFDSEPYLSWWPLVLVVIGVIRLLAGGNRVIAALLIAAGAWLIAYNLEVVDFTLFDLWPLLLIGGGIAMVAKALGYRPERRGDDSTTTTWGVLGVRKVDETSRAFAGRRYVGLLGGCEVDLTGAELAQPQVVVETYSFWGAVELTVPDHWEVVGEVLPVMGAFEVKIRPSAAPEKQLIVRGFAIMAGVDVKSAPRRIG